MAEAFVLVNCLTPEPSIDMKELVIKLKAKISLFRVLHGIFRTFFCKLSRSGHHSLSTHSMGWVTYRNPRLFAELRQRIWES